MIASLNLLIAQENKQPELRQGGYYTEEEGRERLEKLKTLYPALDQWKQRAGLIRANILKATGLTPLPSYTVRNNDQVKWE